MFARLTITADPNNTNVQIVTVELLAISEVFLEILDTTKVSEAVRMTQKQFTYHLIQRSTSKNFHDTSMNYDAKALDAPKVKAPKRAYWANCTLSIEPKSVKDKLGIYPFALLILVVTNTSSALPSATRSSDKKSSAKTKAVSVPRPTTIWITPENWTRRQTFILLSQTSLQLRATLITKQAIKSEL
jgi:hypothetical protein